MKILAIYNEQQSTASKQLEELKRYIGSEHELLVKEFSQLSSLNESKELFDLIIFIADQEGENILNDFLVHLKEAKAPYSPFVRVGPNDSRIMQLSLQKGFDDYLPSDMLFRIPFILNRWFGPGKALPIALYKLIYEDSSEAIAIYDIDSLQMTALNAKAFQVLEENGDPIKRGVKIIEYLDPQELVEKPLRLQQLLEGATITDQRDLITAKGNRKKIVFTVRLVPGRRIIIILRDISDHIKTQENIKQQEKITKLSEKMVSLGSTMYNVSTGKTVWSENMFELLGLPVVDTTPSPQAYMERLHPDDVPFVTNLFNMIIGDSGPERINGKHRIITPDGQQKVLAISLLVEYKNGQPHIIYTANQDITQREEELKHIKESRMVLEEASTISGLGVARWNAHTHEVHWSKGIYDILGLPNGSIPPSLKYADTFLSEEGRQLFWKEVERFKQNPGLEGEYIAPAHFPNKKSKTLKVWAKSMIEDNHVIIYNVVQDITENYENQKRIEELNKQLEKALVKERKKAIQQLRESEEKYRILSETSLDLISAHAPDGTYTFVSEACKDMLGYEKEELIGKNPYDYFHPDDIAKIQEEAHTPLLNKSIENVSITYRFRRKNNEYIWLQSRSKFILDNQEEVLAIHTYSRDISKLVEADIKSKEALKKEREMSELRTQFVTTASHQFRTPLASIKANAQFLRMTSRQPAHNEIFDAIDYEINRLTSLMNDVLTLGKIDAQHLNAHKEYIELPAVLQKAIDQNLCSEQDDRIIEFSVKGAPRVLLLDASLVEHALGNLISNALKYSKGQKAPQISIHYLSKKVRIKIKDFGRGIPKDDQAKLFTSFFRAKNVEDIEGTGLGLVIARQFLESNGGELSFKSKVDKGTTFTITFDDPSP
jgi:PAS domain S-box-containing protein